MNGKTYWRSFGERDGNTAWEAEAAREFPENADEMTLEGVSRRAFMGLVGASTALAGFAQGCVRKPAQYILPYSDRPEDLIPGVPRYFASALHIGGDVVGVLVKSSDGRPTKIEGNPRHPASMGGTDALTQGAVLELYDPNRARTATIDGSPASFESAFSRLAGLGRQSGVAVLVPHLDSPSLNASLRTLAQRGVAVYAHGADLQPQRRAAHKALSGSDVDVMGTLRDARVIVALDADPIGSGPFHVAHARGYADGRRTGLPDEMNRLYAVEPTFSITGLSADNRLQLPASQVGVFAKALAKAVADANPNAAGAGAVRALSVTSPGDTFDTWVRAVASDLQANRSSSAIFVGERQPSWVHALGAWINQALGNVGRTIHYRTRDDRPEAGDLAALATAIEAGRVQHLVVLEGNPVYDSPGDLDVASLLGRVENTIHVAYRANETSEHCKVHVPAAHALECWGDWVSADGTRAIQQPLVEPLFASASPLEALGAMAGEEGSGYELLRGFWERESPAADFERAWSRWLHEGVIDARTAPGTPEMNWSGAFTTLIGENAPSAPTASAMEVVFALDNTVYDGRYANVPWLQELPDPVTKLTWDNAALISPATARALGVNFQNAVDQFDDWMRRDDAVPYDENIPITPYGYLDAPLLSITVDGRTVQIPALVTPGVAEHCVVLPLGYGRRAGGIAAVGAGFDAYPLQSTTASGFAPATVSVGTEVYRLATTQDHNSLEGRAVYRETTAADYGANPDWVKDYDLMPEYKLNSLWEEPNTRTGQQWGMSIDLTTCIGCNACTIACQAENNISVVGKERVLEGREMHWIRLDRYFSGPADNPTVAVQPVACMHCENAPCEQVCPVAATVHGPEGTNDMAYNRCIGTRYCANNCPYKVRRFNFFNFSRENDERNPLYRMQKNPDVTVRFRGVMEKCSYCMQRINGARIEAKVQTPEGTVADGGIVTACEQACPTGAIVFGDVNDETTRVSRMKADPRNYGMLSWLNVHPRTTYLARITNPHPELA